MDQSSPTAGPRYRFGHIQEIFKEFIIKGTVMNGQDVRGNRPPFREKNNPWRVCSRLVAACSRQPIAAKHLIRPGILHRYITIWATLPSACGAP